MSYEPTKLEGRLAVLILEESRALRGALSALLDASGCHQIIECCDHDQTESQLGLQHADVVICSSASVTGIEKPVIRIAASDDADDQRIAMQRGADIVLAKPFTTLAFRDALETAQAIRRPTKKSTPEIEISDIRQEN